MFSNAGNIMILKVLQTETPNPLLLSERFSHNDIELMLTFEYGEMHVLWVIRKMLCKAS